MIDLGKHSNIEAEQALLGAIMLNNAVAHRLTFLRATDFYEELHQHIFAAILERIREGKKADAITLNGDFQNDESLQAVDGNYFARLTGAAVAVLDAEHYGKEIKKLATSRELLQALNTGLALAETAEPAEVSAFVTAEMLKLSEGAAGNPVKDNTQVSREILEDMRRNVRPFPTGLRRLDDAMEGGMYPGKAYGFSARKKMGKTLLAATISYNLAQQDIRHLFICAEMSEKEIHQRQLARHIGVYESSFRSDKKHDPLFQAQVEETTKAKKNIYFQKAPGLTFDQLKMYVVRGINNYKIKGFILDYWQLVGGKQKSQSDASHLDEVAQWIANICRQYDVWAFVTAQINQEGNTRGGEGLRLACDQVYQLLAPEDDASRSVRYLEMMDTRYTKWANIGSDMSPGLYLHEKGLYFSEEAP